MQLIDLNWKNHIQYLEQLRQVIGLRSYGQRDPLVEYKKEAFHSFETLLNKIRQDIVMILLNLKIVKKEDKILISFSIILREKVKLQNKYRS